MEAVTAIHPGVASTGAAAGEEEEDQEMEAEAATGEALGLRAPRPVERRRTDGDMEAETARPTMGTKPRKPKNRAAHARTLGQPSTE